MEFPLTINTLGVNYKMLIFEILKYICSYILKLKNCADLVSYARILCPILFLSYDLVMASLKMVSTRRDMLG
jgi:hypothetical protein